MAFHLALPDLVPIKETNKKLVHGTLKNPFLGPPPGLNMALWPLYGLEDTYMALGVYKTLRGLVRPLRAYKALKNLVRPLRTL